MEAERIAWLGERRGLIQALGGHLARMTNAGKICEVDPAGAKGHGAFFESASTPA
jgi:hypothetical protein